MRKLFKRKCDTKKVDTKHQQSSAIQKTNKNKRVTLTQILNSFFFLRTVSLVSPLNNLLFHTVLENGPFSVFLVSCTLSFRMPELLKLVLQFLNTADLVNVRKKERKNSC